MWWLVLHAAAAGLLAALLIQTLLNLVRLPRLGRARRPAVLPRAAVLIPARDEAERIGACVRAWARQDYPDYEVVVYDGDSSDGTAALAAGAAAAAGHVRILLGRGLPPGWRGKPHALSRLRAAVQADLLVFADADVVPARETLARLAGALGAFGADALSALPTHAAPAAVRVLAAIQHWAVLALVPLWLPRARRRPCFAVLNGQCLAIRAHAYDAVGGFGAVRASLAEDTALGRRLVAQGHRVALADGAELLTCEPYRRLGGLWAATVRYLPSVMFESGALLLAGAVALIALHLGPLALLALGFVRGTSGELLWTWLPLLELALALGARAVADRRGGYPWWVTLAHPLALAALAAACVDAAVRRRRDRPVEWRGRRYRTRRADDRAA